MQLNRARVLHRRVLWEMVPVLWRKNMCSRVFVNSTGAVCYAVGKPAAFTTVMPMGAIRYWVIYRLTLLPKPKLMVATVQPDLHAAIRCAHRWASET